MQRSVQEIAHCIKDLGLAYHTYAEMFFDNAVDDVLLASMDVEKLLDSLEITNELHRTKLKLVLSDGTRGMGREQEALPDYSTVAVADGRTGYKPLQEEPPSPAISSKAQATAATAAAPEPTYTFSPSRVLNDIKAEKAEQKNQKSQAPPRSVMTTSPEPVQFACEHLYTHPNLRWDKVGYANYSKYTRRFQQWSDVKFPSSPPFCCTRTICAQGEMWPFCICALPFDMVVWANALCSLPICLCCPFVTVCDDKPTTKSCCFCLGAEVHDKESPLMKAWKRANAFWGTFWINATCFPLVVTWCMRVQNKPSQTTHVTVASVCDCSSDEHKAKLADNIRRGF